MPEFRDEEDGGSCQNLFRKLNTVGDNSVADQTQQDMKSFDQKADEFAKLVNRFEGSGVGSLLSGSRLRAGTERQENTFSCSGR